MSRRNPRYEAALETCRLINELHCKLDFLKSVDIFISEDDREYLDDLQNWLDDVQSLIKQKFLFNQY